MATFTLYRPFRVIVQGDDYASCTVDIVKPLAWSDIVAYLRCFRKPSENKPSPSRPHRVRSLSVPPAAVPSPMVRPTRLRTRTVRVQLAAPAVYSSSVDEVYPANCSWCRCRPAGVAAEGPQQETTAVDQSPLQAYRSAGGMSCDPLVCPCCIRAAMHGRSFGPRG